MSRSMDRPQQAVATPASARAAGGTAEMQADAQLYQAAEEQLEQAAMIASAPLESPYSMGLAAQVEAKHEQVERIEDRLESLIESQTSRLQRTQMQQPGLLAFPGTRTQWQQQVQQQQKSLQRLLGRLELVREVRDSMGVHAPRIEELAARKLRLQHPELASEWDALQQAQRLHQLLQRQRTEQQGFERGQVIQSGRSMRLGLSQHDP
ncbi:IncP plasmid survival protein KfrC family protein [Janthinobacterium sp. HLX7-2]|uniref:IncP plasmid survival protein KfrC family protein n=1 Tax=Janthinobacterium sp. HLX7-2 TaxID=1259331 RepID=UPI003F21BD35